MAGSRRGAFSGRQASPDRLARTIVAHRARLLAGLLLLCCAAALGWRPLSGGGPGAQQAREGAPGELQQAQRHLVLPGGRRSAAELVAAAGVLANPVQPAAAAAVSASAGVHGFVEKQGPADLHNWHPQYKAFREARLAGWMREREDALAQGHEPPPLPVYTGCQVYVNHLYKVIYLRHAKTASSSLFCHFGGCRDNAADGDTARLRFEILQANSTDDVERLWRDYFVVTFVRNPYQRAISSYRMMARQLVQGGPISDSYSWNQFCADPTGFAEQCMADDMCKRRGRNFVYVHIQPQQQCIVTEGGGWAVDFIGRVENIDEDLGAVLQELERRRPPDAPPIKPLEGSLENVNGRGCNETAADAGHAVAKEQYCEPAEYFQNSHARCFEQIRRHYYGDAHLLQYGPDEAEEGGGVAVARHLQSRRRAPQAT